ncbi:DUF805 domain-containing protein [Lacticaseibacillus pabuli]|uniref:DUF805 domain-containing protein n=1 Tax=Lacticaseibacillus pabuli TaxID=3025672 RepID=A0ABY7WP31_9LACO|nr:DUF805 domain-containing protein [Lacticaseibacillus sp. KACC 23028]WDF81945.1 DUF805 domain-containing protein [Lacticaseibacillus sp. KACC 23028]
MIRVMGPFEALRRLMQRYVDFDGRSPRSAYWWAMSVLAIVAGGFAWLLRVRATVVSPAALFADGLLFGAVFLIGAILAVPYASLHVRRYRDAGVSPWLLLVTVVLPGVLLYSDLGNNLLIWGAVALLVINFGIAALPSRH